MLEVKVSKLVPSGITDTRFNGFQTSSWVTILPLQQCKSECLTTGCPHPHPSPKDDLYANMQVLLRPNLTYTFSPKPCIGSAYKLVTLPKNLTSSCTTLSGASCCNQ